MPVSLNSAADFKAQFLLSTDQGLIPVRMDLAKASMLKVSASLRMSTFAHKYRKVASTEGLTSTDNYSKTRSLNLESSSTSGPTTHFCGEFRLSSPFIKGLCFWLR